MTEGLLFSILLLLVCTYSIIGTFLNWESLKKERAKRRPFNLFDKVLSVILFIISLVFFIFMILENL